MNIFLDDATALVVVLPLLIAAIIAFIPSSRLAWFITIVTLVFHLSLSVELFQNFSSFGTIIYEFGNWPPPWGISFKLDGVNIGLQLLFSAFVLVTTIYSRKIFLSEIDPEDSGKAYSLWLLAIGSLNGIILTNDIFNLFVFLEISALSSISLISLGAGTNRKALLAAFNYLVIGAIGATFYVIGVGFAYAMTGTLNMNDLIIQLSQYSEGQLAIFAGMSFMLIGLMVKSAVFPLHLWLPPAYSYAPSAVSTLFAALATKAILIFFVRILYEVFSIYNGYLEIFLDYILLPLSLIAIFVGTIIAIYQNDIKKLLAYSSIAQIGYITLAFAIGTKASVAAGFIHMFNHAIIKGGLFIAITSIGFYIKKRVTINNLSGLGKEMPITFFCFIICSLSLAGLPLTAGFISKLYLIKASISSDDIWIAILILISSVLSVVYLWKIIEVMWMRDGRKIVIKENPTIYMSLIIITFLNIYFGLDASLVVNGSFEAADKLIGDLK